VTNPVQQPWPPAQPTQEQPPGYPQAEQPKGGNGFAVAALIFGIIGGSVLGLIFGILGVARAKKVNRGKAMAWIGIVLSIIWLIGQIAFVVFVADKVAKVADPGCQAYQTVTTTYSEAKLTADAADPAKFIADLNGIATGLKDAAGKAKSADAKTAIQAEADHVQALLDAINGGQAPDPGFEAQLNADDKAVADACGLTLVK
jgi:hypothetical protein